MTKEDTHASATKEDVKLIMESLTRLEVKVHENTKNLQKDMSDMEDRLIRYIDIQNEQLLHDLRGASDDKFAGIDMRVEDHEQRIGILETKAA